MRTEARGLLQRLGVAFDVDVPVIQLSVARRQFVEIAKALALSARILILDEPTATLTAGDVAHLFRVMRALRDSGVAMIFISHHLDEVFQIADRVQCLRDGRSRRHQADLRLHSPGAGADDRRQGRRADLPSALRSPAGRGHSGCPALAAEQAPSGCEFCSEGRRDPGCCRARGLRTHRNHAGADRRGKDPMRAISPSEASLSPPPAPPIPAHWVWVFCPRTASSRASFCRSRYPRTSCWPTWRRSAGR